MDDCNSFIALIGPLFTEASNSAIAIGREKYWFVFFGHRYFFVICFFNDLTLGIESCAKELCDDFYV